MKSLKFLKLSVRNYTTSAVLLTIGTKSKRCSFCERAQTGGTSRGTFFFREPRKKLFDFYRTTEPGVFCVSKRVVDSFIEESISGVQFHEIVNSKNQVPPGAYFWMETIGEIECSWPELGLGKADICPVCKNAQKTFRPKRFIPLVETWDESDFMRLTNWFNGYVFCTTKILDLARKHRWSNLWFEPMDFPIPENNLIGPNFNIDYMNRRWKGDWYPPEVQPDSRNVIL